MLILRATLFFLSISEIFSGEIFSEPTPPFANHTREIIVPHRSFGFFPNARKCCPYTSAYNPIRRVCLFSGSSGQEGSKWKGFGDPKSSDRFRGMPNCNDGVLVDYELVVKTYFEEDGWESRGEEEDDGPATNASALETSCEKGGCEKSRSERMVAFESAENAQFFAEKANFSKLEEWEGGERIKVLSALLIGTLASDEEHGGEASEMTLIQDGTLRIGDRSYDASQICIDGRDGPEDAIDVTIRVCEPSDKWCSKARSCVRKCCPEGESMLGNYVVVNDGDSTTTIKKRRCTPSALGFPILKELSKDSPVGVYSGHPCGERKKYVLKPDVDAGDKWYLQPNGSLLVPNIPPKLFPQTENCLERVYDPKQKMDGLYAYLCFQESSPAEGDTDQTKENVDRVVYPGALLISCFFLFATLVVYALLPSLRNLHGLTLVSHASCLLAAFICLATVKLSYSLTRHDIGCKILGFSILFTFMAALSWLNVMCFDIWWTFGGFRGRGGLRPGQRGGSGKSGSGLKGNIQRYIFYSIYAWLLPLTITGLTALADQVGEDYLPYAPPGIGVKKCWFEDDGKLAVIIHFVAPSTVLLVADVVMFTLTALRCWKVKAEIHRMQRSDKDDARREGEGIKMFGRRWWKQKYQADKDRLVMNLKLCAAMGVNWSLEIASWWLSRGEESQSQRLLPIATWYASDFANCLHGVFVFVVFVGKKKIMRQLWKRIKNICGCCKKNIARQSTCDSSQQDSSKLSSVHGNSPGREERMYNFNNGQVRKISRLRKWFIKHGLCTKPTNKYKSKDRPLSNSSTTTTSISEERSRMRVSYTP